MTATHETHRLEARGLTLGYADTAVVDDLDLAVPPGEVTVIVGANACGKSTLLRGLARLLKPRGGSVLLDGEVLHRLPTRRVARTLGLLPQNPIAPEGVTVSDLVGRGRHPHHGPFGRWTAADEQAVAEALVLTDTLELADRVVDELSGGQRQRVWIAMALAQGTDLLLLDEPTTYLDVAHQVEMLDLLADLNARRGTTIVMVLHDLNLAARYADHLVALRHGRVVASGTPAEVVTEDVVRTVFGLDNRVVEDPVSHTRWWSPWAATARAPAPSRPARPPRRPDDRDRRTAALLFTEVEVVRVERLSPSFVRVGLGGAGLADFGVDGPRWDQRIKLVFPDPVTAASPRPRASTTRGTRPGRSSPRPSAATCGPTRSATSSAPARRPSWSWTWCSTWRATWSDRAPRGPRPPPSATGSWSSPRAVASPTAASSSPPPGADLLLVGDETAVPAICTVLEQLPDDAVGTAFLEVPVTGDVQDVRRPAGVDVVWLPRQGREHGVALHEAVVAHLGIAGAPVEVAPDEVDPDLWETPSYSSSGEEVPAEVGGVGGTYAWIAGESKVVTGLRRHLVGELGFDRRQVAFMGYWRRGVAMRS